MSERQRRRTCPAADIHDGQTSRPLDSSQFDRQSGVRDAARAPQVVPAVDVNDQTDGVHLANHSRSEDDKNDNPRVSRPGGCANRARGVV